VGVRREQLRRRRPGRGAARWRCPAVASSGSVWLEERRQRRCPAVASGGGVGLEERRWRRPERGAAAESGVTSGNGSSRREERRRLARVAALVIFFIFSDFFAQC